MKQAQSTLLRLLETRVSSLDTTAPRSPLRAWLSASRSRHFIVSPVASVWDALQCSGILSNYALTELIRFHSDTSIRLWDSVQTSYSSATTFSVNVTLGSESCDFEAPQFDPRCRRRSFPTTGKSKTKNAPT